MIEMNQDIYLYLLSRIPCPRELSRLSRTCRALHAAGIKELLQRGVRIHSKRLFSSFILCMRADLEHRAPLVKDMWLACGINDAFTLGEDTEQIAEILECCSFLESLRLCDAYILDEDVRVGAALARLEYMKNLTLTELENVSNVNQVLACMRSRCVSVELDYSSDGREFENLRGDVSYDPILALAPFAYSLQSLTLRAPRFAFGLLCTKYTHVTRLNLHCLEDFEILLLLYTFPNLQYLEIPGTSYLSADEVEEHREENVEAFHQHGWRRLEYFKGSIEVLYALAIRCTIHRVVIHGEYSNLDDLPACLVEALAPTRATKLGVVSEICESITGQFLARVLDALQHIIPSLALTHLSLYVLTLENNNEIDNTLVSELSTLCYEID